MRKQKSQNDKTGIHQVSDFEELRIIVFSLETLMENIYIYIF